MVVTPWDVIVVGGGPAGSATALHLAAAGVRVLVVERAHFPRHKACSEYLSPETTRLLDRMGHGVLAAVEHAAPARLFGMKVTAPNGETMCGRFAAGHEFPSPRPYSFALPRVVFDGILLEAAERAGAVVRQGVAVEGLVADRGPVAGVIVRSAGGARETWPARAVVGADGLHSLVARRLGMTRRGPPSRIALSAHVAEVAGVDDMGELHVSERGYVGMGPIGDGVTTIALVLPLSAIRAGGRDVRGRFYSELERFPGLRGRIAPGRQVREILVTGPFARWSRRSVAPQGGALLVGDAADFFDPFTGQGIYSALRGAELATAALVPALERPAPVTQGALAGYRSARGATFTGKWVLERMIGLGVGWPALTNRVVHRLSRRPDLADLVVGATGNFVPAGRVLAPSVLARLLW